MAVRGIDVIRVAVKGEASGQAVVNVLYYQPAVDTEPDLDIPLPGFLMAFAVLWRGSVLPLLWSGYKVDTYQATVIRGSEIAVRPDGTTRKILTLGDQAEYVSLTADVGTASDPPLPTYVNLTVQKRTGLAGRRNHGSMRLAPLTEPDTLTANGNQLTDAFLTAAASAQAFVALDVDPGGFGGVVHPCLLHVRDLINAAPHAGTVAYRTRVTSGRLNPYVGSQISRKQKTSLGA